MPAGNTYVALATQTLTSAGTVTFSSIPSTYTDLIMVVNAAVATGATNLDIRINSDTGTNYSYTTISGSGTAIVSSRGTNLTFMRLDYDGYLTTSLTQCAVVHFMNYANTTTFKTVLSRCNNASNGVSSNVTLWRSTAAINTISTFTGNLAIGSTLSLYGIAAA